MRLLTIQPLSFAIKRVVNSNPFIIFPGFKSSVSVTEMDPSALKDVNNYSSFSQRGNNWQKMSLKLNPEAVCSEIGLTLHLFHQFNLTNTDSVQLRKLTD